MQWYEWLGVVGSVASLFGVVFSFLAWRKAQKAAEAAEQAREAVQRQAFAESSNVALRDATVLRELTRTQNWSMLQAQAEKLLDWCIWTLNRHPDLPADIRRGLSDARGALRLVIQDVNDVISGVTSTENAANRIMRNINSICEHLNEASGTAQKMLGPMQ